MAASRLKRMKCIAVREHVIIPHGENNDRAYLLYYILMLAVSAEETHIRNIEAEEAQRKPSLSFIPVMSRAPACYKRNMPRANNGV